MRGLFSLWRHFKFAVPITCTIKNYSDGYFKNYSAKVKNIRQHHRSYHRIKNLITCGNIPLIAISLILPLKITLWYLWWPQNWLHWNWTEAGTTTENLHLERKQVCLGHKTEKSQWQKTMAKTLTTNNSVLEHKFGKYHHAKTFSVTIVLRIRIFYRLPLFLIYVWQK